MDLDFSLGISFGLNTILLLICLIKVVEISRKCGRFNSLFIILIFITYAEGLLLLITFKASFGGSVGMLVFNHTFFFSMVQGCDWLYYYRSRLFIMKQQKRTAYDKAIIVFPILVFVCLIPDIALYTVQLYNPQYSYIFEIESSITVFVEIISEIFLYSHIFIKIYQIEMLRNYFKIHRKIFIKIIILSIIILFLDAFVIGMALSNNTNFSITYKSTGYFFRCWLMIEIFYEIKKPFKAKIVVNDSDNAGSDTIETKNITISGNNSLENITTEITQ